MNSDDDDRRREFVVVDVGDLKNLSSTYVNPAYVAPPLIIASIPPDRLRNAPARALPSTAFHPSSSSPRHSRTRLLHPVNDALNVAQLPHDVIADNMTLAALAQQFTAK